MAQYSTQKNVCDQAPALHEHSVCGSLLRVESHASSIEEGGLRTAGLFKRSGEGAPLVSIITVVRNAAATIEQCILSVLSQTYENVEYIVVDGGSKDGTMDIVRQYAGAIDYFVSEPDKGIYQAMNKGLRLASGDFVLILNADDWYSRNAVRLLVGKARETDSDITHANAWVISETGRRENLLKPWLHDGIYTRSMPLRHETMLVSSAAYNKFGAYDESFKIISDFVWTLKAYEGGSSFAHLDRPIHFFRSGGVSTTALDLLVAERKRLFKGRFPFLDDDDLASISNQGFGTEKRLAMLNKHANKSEQFTRSMAFNIAEYSQSSDAEFLKRIADPIRRSFLWPVIGPPLRWIKRKLVKTP